jgi:hypothetical protein
VQGDEQSEGQERRNQRGACAEEDGGDENERCAGGGEQCVQEVGWLESLVGESLVGEDLGWFV